MSESLLQELLTKAGIQITPAQLELFKRYRHELLAWNEKFNLTAILDEQEITIKHFYDSLLAMQIKEWQATGELLDLGSGAGFPGIPLKIMNENLAVTLVDSLQKRVGFLLHLKEVLQISNVKAIHARAEEIGQDPQYREKYETVVSRAVAKLPLLLEYCMPLVKIGGIMLAYKGPEGKGELKEAARALSFLGGELQDVKEFTLPDLGNRSIFVIKKVRNTPHEYPRRAGIPAKKPLM